MAMNWFGLDMLNKSLVKLSSLSLMIFTTGCCFMRQVKYADTMPIGKGLKCVHIVNTRTTMDKETELIRQTVSPFCHGVRMVNGATFGDVSFGLTKNTLNQSSKAVGWTESSEVSFTECLSKLPLTLWKCVTLPLSLCLEIKHLSQQREERKKVRASVCVLQREFIRVYKSTQISQRGFNEKHIWVQEQYAFELWQVLSGKSFLGKCCASCLWARVDFCKAKQYYLDFRCWSFTEFSGLEWNPV